VKAIWVERSPQGYPPREHNLTSLAQKAGVELTKESTDFFDDLSKQYMPTRYPDVAFEAEIEYSRDEADNYRQRTLSEFQWLRQHLS
jgi:HEPN domain-containing protein